MVSWVITKSQTQKKQLPFHSLEMGKTGLLKSLDSSVFILFQNKFLLACLLACSANNSLPPIAFKAKEPDI